VSARRAANCTARSTSGYSRRLPSLWCCQQTNDTRTLEHNLASHLVPRNCNLALAKQQLGHASISSTMMYIGTNDQQAPEAASAVLIAMYSGEQMRSKLSDKESWEWIAAQIREHGLPKRGRSKKASVDADFDELADALLIRA